MIKSMTGYGRNQQTVLGYDISVEIKSINHRYFEFSARVPRAHGYLEDKLKSFVRESVSRGKVDVFVSIAPIEVTDTVVEINTPLAQSYLDGLRATAVKLGISDHLEISDIARFNDIYTLRKIGDDEELVLQSVLAVAQKAVESFNSMRNVEGESLKDDILSRLDSIESYVDEIETRSPQIVSEWKDRLFSKLTLLLEDRQIDEQRILTEAAIFAEKTAVDEEIVRLHSHLSQLRQILSQEDAVGRKLDFLVQELNRETNTIGSKAQDIQTAQIVVEIKSDLEKIREQIQNIE